MSRRTRPLPNQVVLDAELGQIAGRFGRRVHATVDRLRADLRGQPPGLVRVLERQLAAELRKVVEDLERGAGG